MTDHLPECPLNNIDIQGLCMCPELRACEKRVRLEMALMHEREWIEARDAGYEAGLKATHEDPNILASYSWSQGYAAALDAAREAIVALERYVNIPYESPSPAMNGEQGEWVWRSHALAAIDALREEQK